MTFALTVVITFGWLLGADKPNEAAKKEAEKLQGTWAVKTIELDGEKLSDDFVKEIKLVVDGDKIAAQGNFPEKERYGKFTMKIDPGTKPKIIDFILGGSEKSTLEGIYQLEKDEWQICLKLSSKDRPAKFETQQGTETVLVTLKREKP